MPFTPPDFMSFIQPENPMGIRPRNFFMGNRPQELPMRQSRIPTPEATQVPGIQTPHLDAYSQYLNSMPQRGKNSVLEKIVAALAGASSGYFRGAGEGLKTTQEFLEYPYQKALNDWMLKGQGLKDAATLENRNLAQENAQFKAILQNQVGMGRNEAINSQTQARSETARQEQEIKRQELAAKIDMFERNLKARLQMNGEDNASAERRSKMTADAMRYNADRAYQRGIDVADINNDIDLQIAQMEEEGRNRRAPEARPNASYESLEDQRDLAALASKYPNAVKKTPTGKLVPNYSEGMIGSNKEEYDALITELENRRKARRKPASAAKPNKIMIGDIEVTVR